MPIFRLKGDDNCNAELVIAKPTGLKLESHLEDWLENSPPALAQQPILWIGRQTSATVEDSTIFPDLLGVDSEGNLVIVELKKGEASRKVVAQLIEYAAWANELTKDQIQKIAEKYFENQHENKGKNFAEAFMAAFDILDPKDVPPLNRNLRLFIVAEELPLRIANVCRFLRTSHGIDVSCIVVSTFKTEDSKELIVNMETKVGDENISDSKNKKKNRSSSPRWSSDKLVKEVVWEAVQELMQGDKEYFAPKDVSPLILKRYPDFNMNNLNAEIRADTVNNPKRNQYNANKDRYWWIETGKYCLYDPEKHKMESNEEANQAEAVTENST